ncbi:HGR006Cp [Eremothecium sinecaudum]|uniref:HGR006Cp n=1 Tax=Eremothecium sinecaudum TaxID=45286 RepID=A0A0X8HVP4_9SACH|nr:HGR006Cp [Eremothecium sinecaudum]AMD22345.1 HGR006Cp [Eremothecium sinecaudum]
MSNDKRLLDEDANDSDVKIKRSNLLLNFDTNLLETIDKRRLDFESEKICSVTLSKINIYCCLVCGKYLNGRNQGSPAFDHSVNIGHRVFMNTRTLRTYILPDNRAIDSIYLDQIRYSLRPTYTEEEIATFPVQCFDLFDNAYLNGYVGLNSISNNDYANVIFLLISHIKPLRNSFLIDDSLLEAEDEFLQKLTLLVRKLWSPKLFRKFISAHELLQFISNIPNINFKVNDFNDPKTFLLFLINRIMRSSSKELKKRVVAELQGKVEISSTATTDIQNQSEEVKEQTTSSTIKFWILKLELPPGTVFKNGKSANTLPQVRLEELLSKFDGKTEQHTKHNITTNKIVKFPKHLILHIDRFGPSNAFEDRNLTAVEFEPVMKIHGYSYRLMINIVHDKTKPKLGNDQLKISATSYWKVQVRNEADNKWYEFDDITVKPKEEELLFLGESYIQVWEKMPSS